MSSIGAGLIVLSEGVEPVIQMTCRDRNRIGMQSDILGAAALGLKNLLCLTGDRWRALVQPRLLDRAFDRQPQSLLNVSGPEHGPSHGHSS